LLWDFKGHGSNPAPLDLTGLQPDLNIAYQTLIAQPEVDPKAIALLGHSMGGSAVMTASIEQPEKFDATIAISPTKAAVTPQVPANLQLQVGSGEGRFVETAKALLEKAGGQNQNLDQGRGRQLIIVPNVEHITILFSDISHQSALRWLNPTWMPLGWTSGRSLGRNLCLEPDKPRERFRKLGGLKVGGALGLWFLVAFYGC
jgi:pimeloyl-ACP methyl ester carboxylesterase